MVPFSIACGYRKRMKQKRKHKSNASKANAGGAYLMAGTHACLAALANPAREVLRLCCTRNAYARLPESAKGLAEQVEPALLDQMVGADVVHQGMVMQVSPLPAAALEDVLAAPEKRPLLVLDQVTDPHNVGAMLRSAAAFDVAALVTTHDNSASESAALAKAACGGLDLVPWVRVVNLAKALEEMKAAGYWIAGMDGSASQTISQTKLSNDTALVMGAEGTGLRRLTQEKCDYLVKLDMSDKMESLNVSNAAAIALHTLYVR